MEREQRVAQHTKYRSAAMRQHKAGIEPLAHRNICSQAPRPGACRPRAQSRASDIKPEKMRNPLSEATRSLRPA
jgi:hypothetical protein